MKITQSIDRDALIRVAMHIDDSLTLYVACPDFVADEDWGGSSEDEDGNEIVLLAQNDTDCLYGYETTDADKADYLITGRSSAFNTPELDALDELLDSVFGGNWPDNYAQTHGWSI